ncbi:MAG: hypothetical protein GC160_13695 [Acidobacteria bacterium]|nr:hypothetical protein [Acidobacteriota bacterium]
MKRFSFGAPVGLLAAFLLGAAFAQQAQQPTQAPELTAEERLAQLEERWDALERSLSRRVLQDNPSASPISLETRLSQLESRVNRLEQQAVSGMGGGDRYLESRVRALESEVARLRR